MKMATKKKSKIIEVWNKVGYAKDVKDTTISIPDFLAFVKENTPANVKEKISRWYSSVVKSHITMMRS